MDESVLKTPDEVMPYVDLVRQLGDDHRQEFGFLAETAYTQAARRNNLWVSVEPLSHAFQGYLLLGGVHPRRRVFHICVHPDYRKSGIGRKLISELIRYSTERGYLYITARVSSKLNANFFWNRVGFSVVDLASSKTKGTNIRIYSRDLDVPSLFDEDYIIHATTAMQLDPRKPVLQTPSYVIDLNMFFDAHHNRDDGQSSRIMASAFRHEFLLYVTPEFIVELQRSSRDPRNDPVLTLAKHLPILPQVNSEHLKPITADLERLLSPTPGRPRQWKTHDQSDIIHIAYSIYHGAFGFITRDKAILRHGRAIEDRFHLRVVSPDDILDDVISDKSAINVPLIAASAGDLQATDISEQNRESVNLFLSKHDPKKRPLVSWPGAMPGSASDEPIVFSSSGEVVGLGLWTGTRHLGSDSVLHLFVDEDHPHADQAIDHALLHSANKGDIARVWRFNLKIPRNQKRTRETVLKRGFHPQSASDNEFDMEYTRVVIKAAVRPNYWSDVVVNEFRGLAGIGLSGSMPSYDDLRKSGFVLKRDGARGVWSMSLFDFETFVSPGLLIAPGRKAVIVPIRDHYADDLLPETWDQRLAFSAHEAAFRVERAYFLRARMHRRMPQGTIVVFYVSGKRGHAVALARVTYCQTLTTTQAALNLRRQGVLSERELRNRADRSGKVTAVTFDNVLAFPNRIGYAELNAMKCIGGANLVTAQPIQHDALCRIVEMAFGD